MGVWNQVADALVSGMRSYTGNNVYRDPDVDTEGVPVFDGAGGTEDTSLFPLDLLVIGQGMDPEEISVGESTEGFISFPGTRSRQDDGFVKCVAMATSPENNQKAARDAAFGMRDDVADMIRPLTTPHLGVTGLNWAYMGRYEVAQMMTDQGAVCAVEFEIRYQARI